MNLTLDWTEERYQEFLTYLKTFQDLPYHDFHSKITECENMIGIKTSILKQIAKEISKGSYQEFIKINNSDLYEPIMIEGFIYGNLKINFEVLENYLDKYLKKVNNWAHVDLLVTSLKQFKKNQEAGFKYAKKLIHSKNNWSIRCGIVILLSYYLHDNYIDKTLEIVSKIKSNDYYVQMAIAWLISTSYIKYKETTLLYLVNLQDNFVYNKTLSKIADSRRISIEEKKFIRSLKRKEEKEKIGS